MGENQAPMRQSSGVPRAGQCWYDWPMLEVDLVQAALLQHDVFANDEAVGGHFFELRQNAADVLVGIDERDDDGQLASGFDQMRGVDAVAAEESGNRVVGDSAKDVFFAQILQNLKVQRAVMPGVSFG